MNKSYLGFAAATILALVLGVVVGKTDLFETKISTMQAATVLPKAKFVNDFSLLDQNGNEFTKASLQGKLSVLFFGFTNCPDVCPNTLQFLKSVKKSLVESGDADKLQVILVSVDPKRDTPEKLSLYLPYFDKEFIGLTGTEESIAAFTKQLAMPYIVQDEDEHGNYNVDHSASLVVLDKQGNMKAIISQPHELAEITHDLKALLK